MTFIAFVLLIALALLIALYLVNEQRRREKLKVDRAVIMLGTLLMDKKNNGKWRRQWEWIVENNTPVKGDPYSQVGGKKLRAQVSVLIKVFKLLDDKGV